jgi:dTDP-4-dehydrorhamnose 3,5-epimerase
MTTSEGLSGPRRALFARSCGGRSTSVTLRTGLMFGLPTIMSRDNATDADRRSAERVMTFRETPLAGAFVVDVEKRADSRGFFARAWCQREFEEHGLSTELVQCNLSFNERRGTLRGMHYQAPPHEEVKLIRCTRGAVYDVIVDLRPGSRTYKQWFGVELSAENRRTLYVPAGFAHGYQTLEDGSETFYQVSAFYAPEAEGGVRWDDPAFRIKWPDVAERTISDKDANWPDFERSPFMAAA